MSSTFTMRLPATSANLGPGFDALGLAMDLALDITALESAGAKHLIEAEGRDADHVGALEGNLMLDTYRSLAPQGPALQLRVNNGIPLGMGCGSSAAALVAGVLLADHFGGLGWTRQQVLEEACRREGHPDNVAACMLGGLTASSMRDGRVTAATLGEELPWRLLLALPPESLATEKARALLPSTYARADAVTNVQSTALLVAAFALCRADLLLEGTRDLLHQPYRSAACPLLPRLLPLAGTDGIWAVTLSGAGPSVLLLADPSQPAEAQRQRIRDAAGDSTLEVLETRIAGGASFTGKTIK